MDFKLMLLNGVLKTIGRAHPEYANVIDTVIKHEDKADEIIDVIKNAAAEGAPAVEAARAAAPNLEKAIRSLVSAFAGHAPTAAAAAEHIDLGTENALRDLAGADHVDMDQQRKWMDDTTANLRDSQAGGG